LVYALSGTDERKQTIARELLRDTTSAISTQVLLETTNVLVRKLGRSPAQAAGLLRDLMERPVLPHTKELVEESWRVAERYKLSTWDSAVVAAALHSRCNLLHSEDLQDGQVIEGLTFHNPFKADHSK
jgi:predicted nucleic acid-binding protein